MIRIAYVCTDPGIAPHASKGASVHFRQFGRALVDHGVQLDTFSPHEATEDWPGRPRSVTPQRRKGSARELAGFSTSLAVADALATHGPYDAIYERLSLFGMSGLVHARDFDIPLIVEVNAPLWIEASQYRTLHLARTALAAAVEVMETAARVLVVSSALRDELVAIGVAREKLAVVPNGVDEHSFAAGDVAELPSMFDDGSVAVFIGSLKPWHGIEFLLSHASQLYDEHGVALWIVGDGPLRDRVAEEAAKHPHRIHAQGVVPHSSIPSILRRADVALAPYPVNAPSYFCPLKVVEALAAGTPLVASRHPCVTRSLDDLGVDWTHHATLFEPDSGTDFLDAVASRIDSRRHEAPPLHMLSWSKKAKDLITWIEARTTCGLR